MLARYKKTIFFVLILFFIISTALLYADQHGSVETVVQGIEEHFVFFRDHFPRHDGSEHERQVLRYIEDQIRAAGLSLITKDFDHFPDAYSFSNNIEVNIQGQSEDTFLIVVPVNHAVDAEAEGEAWNLAIGLEILLYFADRRAQGGSLPMGLTVLFAGGEYVPDSSRQLGSELFLETYYPEKNVGVIYLQIQDVPGTILLKNGENSYFSPYWIIERFTRSLKLQNLAYKPELQYTQLFRLGISNKTSMIDNYLRQEFPALEVASIPFQTEDLTLTDNQASLHDQREFLFALICSFSTFMELEGGQLPEDWDRHYIFLQLGDFHTVVTESVYIFLLIGIFTGIFLFIFFFRRRMGKYRMVLVRKFWVLIVLFAIIFIFLSIGTYVIQGISAFRYVHGIWQERPLLFLFLKLSAALSFFFFLFRFVKRFPFPLIRSFYSASAIFLFFMLLLVVSIYNISLTYYFVWAFLLTIFFSIFQNRFAKLFCLLVASLSLVYGLYQLFSLRAYEGLQFIIISPLYGNLFISLILLPFILMIIRTTIAFHDAAVRELHVHGWVLYAFPVGAFAALVLYSFLFTPFTPENPREIRVREVIDYELEERKLTAISDAPLGSITVGSPDYDNINAEKTRTVVQYAESMPDLLNIDLKRDDFLDRKYYTITLQAEGQPINIDILIHSQQPLIIYDANFPFQVNPGEKKSEIHLGAFPPVPLKIEIVLPLESDVDAQCIVEYMEPPYNLGLSAENAKIQQRTTFIEWVNL